MTSGGSSARWYMTLEGIAGAAEGWLLAQTNALERVLLLVAGLLLVYPKAAYDAIGFALLVAAVVLQLVRRRTALAASG